MEINTLKIQRLTSERDPLFAALWNIYIESFPLFEQRTLQHQCTAFKSNHYHLDAYMEKSAIVGLVGYWVFNEYAYIEHFAVNCAARCGGYGSRIMTDFLGRTGKLVILEIDPIVDEISMRRLGFYNRLGFVENPQYIHPLPRYQENDHREVNLSILTHPISIDHTTYERFNHDLQSIVMSPTCA